MSPNTGNNSCTDAARRQRGPLLFSAVLLTVTVVAANGCSCRDEREPVTQPEVTPGLPDPAERLAELAARPEVTVDLITHGKKLYDDNCLVCHGDRGKGDGKAAYLLLPKPRDFTEGTFNRKNTPPKNLPADEDLFTVVSDGLLESSMPPWKDYLTGEERWAVIEYLKRALIAIEYDGVVTSRYDLTPPEEPLAVPEEIPATAENIARGNAFYNSVSECWTCHGREGKGDGPLSQKIVNRRGERIYPLDLTKGVYKFSTNNEEIFRRIRDGIPMAAMLSMGQTLTDEEVWCLVHYVRSLVSRSDDEIQMHRQFRRTIAAKKVDGDLPKGPDDEKWAEISASYVPLIPLWWRRERIEGVFVRAAHDGNEISLQLSWVDDTEDRSVIRTEDFHDGAAIQFSAAQNPPLFAMGAAGAPVNIWHWKADWEREQTLDQAYPNMVSDHYQDRTDNVVGELGQEKAALSKHDPAFLTGWGAGNPMSNPERKTPMENLVAGGVGTITAQGPSGRSIRGAGNWYKGFWRVTFTRELSSGDEDHVTFSGGQPVNIGFAVWNGAQMDRNGQKSVTIWHRLELEK